METMTIQSPIAGVVYPTDDKAREYFQNGAWHNSTVGQALRATAARIPESPAFLSEERTVTFRELDDASERLGAALLRLGLVCGDRAIFQLGTTVETAVVLLACYKAGIVPVCSLPQHREVEIGQLAEKSA